MWYITIVITSKRGIYYTMIWFLSLLYTCSSIATPVVSLAIHKNLDQVVEYLHDQLSFRFDFLGESSFLLLYWQKRRKNCMFVTDVNCHIIVVKNIKKLIKNGIIIQCVVLHCIFHGMQSILWILQNNWMILLVSVELQFLNNCVKICCSN